MGRLTVFQLLLVVAAFATAVGIMKSLERATPTNRVMSFEQAMANRTEFERFEFGVVEQIIFIVVLGTLISTICIAVNKGVTVSDLIRGQNLAFTMFFVFSAIVFFGWLGECLSPSRYFLR